MRAVTFRDENGADGKPTVQADKAGAEATGKGQATMYLATGAGARKWRIMLSGLALAMLAGCDESGQFSLLPDRAGPEGTPRQAASGSGSVRLVERDVEAPEVFQVTDMGLWDGRPSLGGVWVAHPDVKEPERVIIRSTSDGKFVIGALFRRERDLPGPAMQVSSDAAEALGMLAGAPAQLNVTALRREEAPDPETAAETAPEAAAPTETLEAPGTIETTALDPVTESATAAIEAAEAAESTKAPEAVAAAPAPVESARPATPAPRGSTLERPFIQIGIFSIEKNARNTATAMRQAGMVPTVLEQSSQGKTFWRVIVGPATSSTERATLLKKIKDIGFDDAYAVTN